MSDAFGVSGAGQDLCSMLRMRARTLLVNNTLAQNQVETSRDEAFTDDDKISIAIYTPKISRTWLGDSPPQFQAKVTLALVGRVMPGATLLSTEAATDMLRVQMENAILAAPAFYAAPLERVNSVETAQEFPGDNENHEGQIVMTLECQCTDVFAWNAGAISLDTVGVTIPNLTIPAGTTPADNLIGEIITIPQGD